MINKTEQIHMVISEGERKRKTDLIKPHLPHRHHPFNPGNQETIDMNLVGKFGAIEPCRQGTAEDHNNSTGENN